MLFFPFHSHALFWTHLFVMLQWTLLSQTKPIHIQTYSQSNFIYKGCSQRGFAALLIPWIWACAQSNEEYTFRRSLDLKERIFKWSLYKTLVQKSHMQACKNKTAHKISRLPRFSREIFFLFQQRVVSNPECTDAKQHHQQEQHRLSIVGPKLPAHGLTKPSLMMRDREDREAEVLALAQACWRSVQPSTTARVMEVHPAEFPRCSVQYG